MVLGGFYTNFHQQNVDNFVFCVDNYKNYPHFDKNNFCQFP